MRQHIDIFAGLAGFSLACLWNDVQTVAQVEKNPDCLAFLKKTWPNIYHHDDINTFDARPFYGIWLLTSGAPCQPASRAGNQLGEKDDRWLWPQTLTAFRQCHPTWAILENPPGIGDVGLRGILAEVEAENYEVRVFSIPACAVGAPHGRERYWIVCRRIGVGQADPDQAGRQGTDAESGSNGLRSEHFESDGFGVALGDTESERGLRRSMPTGRESRSLRRDDRPTPSGPWERYVWLPCADGKIRRAPDDSFDLVDGLHRSVLAALGNSIVPQVAAQIIRAMIASEELFCERFVG